jgi:hypothetical protein
VDGAGSAAMIDAIVEVLATEAEALLTAKVPGGDDRLADLNVRQAMLSADVLADSVDAARYLELADRHPLTARLRLGHGAAAGDRALLRRRRGRRSSAWRRSARGAGPRCAATSPRSWLYAQGAADRGARGPGRDRDRRRRARRRRELRELTALARAAGRQAWRDAADAAVRRGHRADATAELLAQAQALVARSPRPGRRAPPS